MRHGRLRAASPLFALALAFAAGAGGCDKDERRQPATNEPAPLAPSSEPDGAQSTAAPPEPRPQTAVPGAGAADRRAGERSVLEPSPEPELAEWGNVREVVVPGSGQLGCETKMVREWLRVMCVPRETSAGKPVRIEIVRGRTPGERSRGENLSERNGITTLVAPVRPGADLVARFHFAAATHTLSARWPDGEPESARAITFDLPREDSDGKGEQGEGIALVPTPAPGAATPAGIPTFDAWKAAKEVVVKGSTALGCETKVSGEWLRVLCAAKNEWGSAPDGIDVTRGGEPGKFDARTGGPVGVLHVHYVAGVDIAAAFTWGEHKRLLEVNWPAGTGRPEIVGSFSER